MTMDPEIVKATPRPRGKRLALLVSSFLVVAAGCSLVYILVSEPLTLAKTKLKLINAYQFPKHLLSDKQDDKDIQVQLWEQPILLNLFNFSWIMNNESICHINLDHGGLVRPLPILVHSARTHFEERRAIRKTYGSVNLYRMWSPRLIFLLGESPTPNDNKSKDEILLREEQVTFGDLIMGTFIDSYRNLTYKHLMGYKWILNFCPGATFVLKIDDDMFINIPKWVDMRIEDLEYQKRNKSKLAQAPDLYCQMRGRIQPSRWVGDKWYTTMDEWPSPLYPEYCYGWAYATSIDFIRKIYSVSRDIRFFWIDDVFVTGALREVAKNKYNWEPRVKHFIVDEAVNWKRYSSACDNQTWGEKREIVVKGKVSYVIDKMTVPVSVIITRGKLFEKDMTCLWNITMFREI